jgi:hypothetical protein
MPVLSRSVVVVFHIHAVFGINPTRLLKVKQSNMRVSRLDAEAFRLTWGALVKIDFAWLMAVT